MLSAVAGQQPRYAPIDCLERPTAVIRMIVALRKTLTSMVENRSLSNASQSSGRSFHAAMTSSVQLRETDQLHEVYKKTNYRPMYYPYALSNADTKQPEDSAVYSSSHAPTFSPSSVRMSTS